MVSGAPHDTVGTAKGFRYDHELAEGEIRLVLIQPGSWADAINISLLYREQDTECIQYDALSYVWGTPSDPISILCDDKPISVTQNLHKALLQLRENGLTTPIWIDAICIDQSNLDERTRQVRMMKQIYSHADMVHIWLGEASAKSKTGVDLIHNISEKLRTNVIRSARNLDLEALGFSQRRDPQWEALADILTRPWFERVWVIQERTVAQACMYLCGRYKISSGVLDSLVRFESFAGQLQDRLLLNRPSGVEGTMVTQGTLSPAIARYHRNGSLSLTMLLSLTSNYKATDPRDKIFALIGLTNGVPTDFIDYRLNLEDVLINLCVLLLTRDSLRMPSALDVLSFVNHTHRSLDLPSWVPEWRYKGDSFIALSHIMQPREWIDVGKASYAVENGKRLTIRGKILDRVQTLTQGLSMPGPNDLTGKTPMDFAPQIQAWHDNVAAIVSGLDSYPMNLDPEEALWRTMCFNGGEENEPAPASYGHAYRSWRRVQASTVRLVTGNDDPLAKLQLIRSIEQDLDAAKPIELALSKPQAGRCFCVTDKGYIGWATLAASEGDLIAALWGTRLLFTLRQVEGGYNLTGDCYLQGLMEGEALRKDEILDEQIVIL